MDYGTGHVSVKKAAAFIFLNKLAKQSALVLILMITARSLGFYQTSMTVMLGTLLFAVALYQISKWFQLNSGVYDVKGNSNLR